MPRVARLAPIPFGWYYVALKSVAGRRIVKDEDDLVAVYRVLRRTLREKRARLHAGYVSEREAHLVLQVGETPLSAITGFFQHEYARVFNARHGEHGSLFRLHYRSLLFQHERWLGLLVHVVHWLRALEPPATGSRRLWWSTDAAYRGEVKQDWVTTSALLRMLTRGVYRRTRQEEAYRELMAKPPDPRQLRLFRRGSVEDSRLLGERDFIAQIWRMEGRRIMTPQRRVGDVEEDIREILLQIITRFNAVCASHRSSRRAIAWEKVLNLQNLRSKSRKRPLPMLRALSVSYLLETRRATRVEAARFFGRGAKSWSPRRRRQYADLFRKYFGVDPVVLFTDLTLDPDDGGPARPENLHGDTRNPLGRSVL